MRASFIYLGQPEMPMPQYTSPRPAAPTLRKPRNPFAAFGQQRQAGRHQPPHARQGAQRALKSELRELWHPPSSD